LFVTQRKNRNTAFHRGFAVSVGLALESDVTAVLNCEKLVDKFACLKARKKLCDRLLDMFMLVANTWYRLLQIITYLPSSSSIQLLVLVRATCVNGFKRSLQEDLEQWCSQTFWLEW